MAHAKRSHPDRCPKQEHASKSGQTGINWWAPHEPEHGSGWQSSQQSMRQQSRTSCHLHTPAMHGMVQTMGHAAKEHEQQQQQQPPPGGSMHAQAGQHTTGAASWLVPRSVALVMSALQPQLAAPPQQTPDNRVWAAREQSSVPQLSALHNEIESFARQAMPTEVHPFAHSKVSWPIFMPVVISAPAVCNWTSKRNLYRSLDFRLSGILVFICMPPLQATYANAGGGSGGTVSSTAG